MKKSLALLGEFEQLVLLAVLRLGEAHTLCPSALKSKPAHIARLPAAPSTSHWIG
jgi:hypothetical protein